MINKKCINQWYNQYERKSCADFTTVKQMIWILDSSMFLNPKSGPQIPEPQIRRCEYNIRHREVHKEHKENVE